jgi:hypothetical protein
MRTNPVGQPGKYSCDRCHQPSPRGVYTGQVSPLATKGGFCHVCPTCKGDIAKGDDLVSRIPSTKRIVSATQIAAMRAGRAAARAA